MPGADTKERELLLFSFSPLLGASGCCDQQVNMQTRTADLRQRGRATTKHEEDPYFLSYLTFTLLYPTVCSSAPPRERRGFLILRAR